MRVLIAGMPENLLPLIEEIARRDPGRATVELMSLNKIWGKRADLVIVDEIFGADVKKIIEECDVAAIPMLDIRESRRSKGDRH